MIKCTFNKRKITLVCLLLFLKYSNAQYSIYDAYLGHWDFKKKYGSMDLDFSKKTAKIYFNDSQLIPFIVFLKEQNDSVQINSINNKISINITKFKRKRRYSKLFIELFINNQKYKLIAIRKKDIQSYYWRKRFYSLAYKVSCPPRCFSP